MEMQEAKTFKNAIESGLAAARNADRALDEVKGVLKAVRVAMLEMSDEFVRIEGLSVRSDFLNGGEEVNSIEIAANLNGQSDRRWRLGQIRITSVGFPVTVTDRDGVGRVCTSAEELEGSLALLLHTPEFGRWYRTIHEFVRERVEREARLNAKTA